MRVARPAGYAVGMKTAVSIPDDIFERAECLASQERRSRSEVHAMALQEHLVRHLRDEVTETMNRACDRARSHRMVFSHRGPGSPMATVDGELRGRPEPDRDGCRLSALVTVLLPMGTSGMAACPRKRLREGPQRQSTFDTEPAALDALDPLPSDPIQAGFLASGRQASAPPVGGAIQAGTRKSLSV